MGLTLQFLIYLFILCSQRGVSCIIDKDDAQVEPKKASCSTSDLNHSILVECNESNLDLNSSTDSLWPSSGNHIVHVWSSRSGDRFAVKPLEKLNVQESELERTLNINTTLYIYSNHRKQEIHGFGTKIDFIDFLSRENDKSLHTVYGPILKELFGNNQFSMLSIPVPHTSILNEKASEALHQVDSLASKVLGNRPNLKIKVILNLDDLEGTLEMIEALKAMAKSKSTLQMLQIWALTVNQDWLLKNSSNEGMLGFLQELFATKKVLAITNTTSGPEFVDAITKSQSALRGLLLKSSYSLGYNALIYIKESRGDLSILSLSSDKPRVEEYGDWDNSQNYAVEILKHLGHGSEGFLENISSINILREPYNQDCSIYSIGQTDNTHFRGPMFYAIGQFSRHVVPGSKLLETSVFTQPNMFAAHYISFITPLDYIVTIVLNDNEHMLPFRVAVDGHIVAYLNLQPKSFNTIVVKH